MQELMSVLQANLIGIVLMIITLFSLIKNLRSGILADKLFFMLVLSIMVVCLMEILGTVFNHQTFPGAKELNLIFNALLFAVNPIPAFLWALFATCKVYKNEKRLVQIGRFLLIPLVIVVGLSIANLFTDIFFSISDENVYSRANFFFVATMLSALYIIYVVVIVLVKRKDMGKQLFIPMLCFMIPPVFGLVIQFLFYGVYMLWVCVSISVIIIFNHVQNDASITDWLTGLYNRRHLDSYLQQMCRRNRDKLLVGYMIDIDDFKAINDTYGHLTGDRALKDTAAVLKEVAGSRTYLARYAGDEFVVIMEASDETTVKHTLEKFHRSIAEFNLTAKNPYQLSFSIGYSIYKGSIEENEDEFMSRMDSAMYLAKSKTERIEANQ